MKIYNFTVTKLPEDNKDAQMAYANIESLINCRADYYKLQKLCSPWDETGELERAKNQIDTCYYCIHDHIKPNSGLNWNYIGEDEMGKYLNKFLEGYFTKKQPSTNMVTSRPFNILRYSHRMEGLRYGGDLFNEF